MDANQPMKNYDQTLSIQHDWHVGLREPVSTFFLGIKPSESSRTEFFDVQITKLVDEYGFAVMPGTGAIKASDFTDVSLDSSSQKHLHVTFQGKTTIFIAPSIETQIVSFNSPPQAFDVSSTGATFVSADSSGSLHVISASDYSTLRSLNGHVMDITRCVYFPSGLVVLSGGMDRTLRIFAVDTGKCARVLKGHTQSISGLGIIKVGKEVLSCSNDGTARKWNCGKGETVESWAFEKGKCVDLAVSADSTRFAVICELKLLSVIDLFGEKKRRDIPLPSEPSSLCFSGDETGKAVFVGFEDGRVAAYDVSKEKMIGEIITNKGSVNCLKIHEDKILVAFGTGNVLLYEIPKPSGDSDHSNIISAKYELTGADCDPIYAMAVLDKKVFTCCRDRKIRMYNLP